MPIIYVHGDAKKAQEWHGNWACNNCNCRWKAVAGDATPSVTANGTLDAVTGRFYTTPCPHCGKTCVKEVWYDSSDAVNSITP